MGDGTRGGRRRQRSRKETEKNRKKEEGNEERRRKKRASQLTGAEGFFISFDFLTAGLCLDTHTRKPTHIRTSTHTHTCTQHVSLYKFKLYMWFKGEGMLIKM